MNTFANNPEHRYSNLGTLDDVRDPRGNTTSEAQEDIMNSWLLAISRILNVHFAKTRTLN